MGGQRLADEKKQSLHFEFVHDSAFYIGVAAGDERRLYMLCWNGLQAEGQEFIFDVASGNVRLLSTA